MPYTLLDLAGLSLATLAHGLVVLLPAVAIAHAANVFAMRRMPPLQQFAISLLVAYAVLPLIDSLAARFIGLDAALGLNLALAAAGAHIVWRHWLSLQLPRAAFGACAAWFILIALATIDIDGAGRLNTSLLMIDTVKHAATVRALLDTGAAPPLDPFFLRSDPAGYYYYFYVASALAARLGAGLFDARAAFAGQIFWIGLALYALFQILIARTGFARLARGPALRNTLLAVLVIAGGLQILPLLAIAGITGTWLAQTAWWGEQVTSFLLSALWVPHHLAGLIACWTGLIALSEAVSRCQGAHNSKSALQHAWQPVALAAAAFACAAGLSIWVTSTACLAIAIWLTLLARERRWPAVVCIVAAGLGSAILSLPHLWDLVHYRAQAGVPVAVYVRGFLFADALLPAGILQTIGRIVMLPLNYGLEFGIFAIGALLYWRHPPHAISTRARDIETRRLVAVTGAAGLFVATFLKSTVISNDLGWRGVLFAQAAATLWSFAAFAPILREALAQRRMPSHDLARISLLALALGIATVVYDVQGLRTYARLGLGGIADIIRNQEVDLDLRRAYEALALMPEAPTVMQHNPDADRTFAYGLYGKARVAVSDRHNGMIFGASSEAVHTRVGEIIPIFKGTLEDREALQRLRRYKIGALVVTSADPIWRDEAAWIWSAPTLFASDNVRVLRVEASP